MNSYADNRYISSCEACWRLFCFDIAECIPPVMALRIHLENEQHMAFLDGEEEEALSPGQETGLTAFFRYHSNQKDTKGDSFDPYTLPTYVNMPE